LTGAEEAYALGIKLLSFRPRSERELFSRLEGRFGREVASITVRRLKQEGYVDDLSFAGWWVAQRAAFKPMGRLRLKQELVLHGVDPGTAGEALAGFGLEAEAAAALEAARRKLPALAGERQYLRLAHFLARRGFPRAVIDEVVKALRGQGDDFY